MPSLEDLKSDYARAEAALNVAAEVREEALQEFMAALASRSVLPMPSRRTSVPS